MDADERLLGLKKAYADILLNTSKEAAARIMVAERKAVRFQHEMTVVKEEAIQMMTRLKNMMESKVNEAVKTSKIQQAKIDELEAQLQEAEDIVNDLREELRLVQDKLERNGNNNVQHLDRHDTTIPKEAFEVERQCPSMSVIYPPTESKEPSLVASNINTLCLNQGIEYPDCYDALINLRNFYGAKQDLPSIISRSKEHESYRNGCTQRIRACESNLLDGVLTFSRGPKDTNCERNVSDCEEDKSICPQPDEIYNVCNMQKKEVVPDDSSFCQVQDQNSLQRKRNRTTRYRIVRSPTCKLLPDRLKLINLAPKVSCSNVTPNLVKKNEHPEADCNTLASKLSLGTDDVSMQAGFEETTESKVACPNDFAVKNMIAKSEAFTKLSVPVSQEGRSIECSISEVFQTNIEKADEPIIHSMSKASDTKHKVPCQPVDNRVIKYTFQRKRKRDAVNVSDENGCSENNSNLEEKVVGVDNDSADPGKSCSVAESSRESRRLAQVARQLISLSEKKWHK